MIQFFFLSLLGIHGAVGVTHSLKYFYTASSGIPDFPAYVSVGLVDDLQISHCDSITNKNVPKQEWMERITAEDPQYWEKQTQICAGHQLNFKNNIQVAKERFNQTGGTHVVQYMYGCEWDDQNDEVGGYRQHGYDGADFLVWDTKTNTWVAAKQQGFMTSARWNNDKAQLAFYKNYLTQECPEWLKKYVSYGRTFLMKTVLPSVSLLQKTLSSPITCHATGFYPNRAEMIWRKNGVELHEGVGKGEILTNNDGTFQMSVDLDIRSVPAEDWGMYDCVFQLSGVNEDVVTKLDKAVVKTNEGPSAFPIPAVVGGVFGGLVGIMVILGLAAVVYKKCLKKGNNGFKPANNSDTSSSSSDGSDTKKVPAEEQKMISSTA
ncbi:major histocompatibility complex class I-related gene protein-like [Oreochromis aureus]|uniref:Ig-like domain-containing protein n=1 Tax=Oreochromis aureus TaxID=47969 RepID=A0A668S0Q4_OREAU|nr:major histocompatibility complex class I-related gene protein-like [Oreochromis aureus]